MSEPKALLLTGFIRFHLFYIKSHNEICIHLNFKTKGKLKKEQQSHSFLKISIQQLCQLIVDH